MPPYSPTASRAQTVEDGGELLRYVSRLVTEKQLETLRNLIDSAADDALDATHVGRP